MTGKISGATLVGALGILTICCLTFGGCKGRELERAQQEAREARNTAAKLDLTLTNAEKEISQLKAERDALRVSRDELQEQADELVRERDKASTLAQQAQAVITHLTARAGGQADATAALQREITELKALVEEQQATIEELRTGGVEAPIPAEPVDDVGLPEGGPDVNEPVGEDAGG